MKKSNIDIYLEYRDRMLSIDSFAKEHEVSTDDAWGIIRSYAKEDKKLLIALGFIKINPDCVEDYDDLDSPSDLCNFD